MNKRKTVIIAGIIGNIMEWYDFALYGYMAAIISLLFFPNQTKFLSLLSTYGIFAVGFVMRPIGAAVFGWLGDTIGRSRTMLISVIVMMIPTFALGLLPTYSNVGIWAPILLIIMRLVQGFSVGGEFSSSVTYLVETSAPSKRGLSGSWSNLGSGMGMLLGSLVAASVTSILSADALNSWGWRLPFLLGGILGSASIILRKNLPDSQHFKEHAKSKEDSSPIKDAFFNNTKQVAQGTLFASGYGALFYLSMVYIPTWLNAYTDFSLGIALKINALATLLLTLLIPFMAWISDKYIRRTHFAAMSVAIMAIAAIPLFLWTKGGTIISIIITQAIFAVLISVLSGTAPAIFVELFPTRDRLSGYSIAFNVGMGIIGGSTPMVVTWLIAKTGLVWFPAIYMLLGAIVSLFALLWIKDRSREPLL